MLKLHIIIPTRERAETLQWTLRSCLHQDNDNYDIWVSDNCSTDNTCRVVKSFNDSKIHYIKTPERLSMTGNFEFALSHIQDGYLMFLGDDDALLPNVLKYISDILTKTKTELLTWKVHRYNWNSHLLNEYKNVLTMFFNINYFKKKSEEQLVRASKLLDYDLLPTIYYGFCSIDIINKIKEKTQCFFNARVPDYYSAVVLSHSVKSYIYSNFGFSIAGHSQNSTGCSYSLSMNEEKNKPIQMYMNENNLPFHPLLEFNGSGSRVLLADSLLWANEKIPQIPKIDIKDVITQTLMESKYVITKEKQNEMISALSIIAEKNKLTDFFKAKKEELFTPVSFVGTNPLKMGFNEEENSLTLNCKDLNITNVYSASLLIRSLLNKPPVYRKFNPLKVSKVRYFVRGFYESFFTLKEKLFATKLMT